MAQRIKLHPKFENGVIRIDKATIHDADTDEYIRDASVNNNLLEMIKSLSIDFEQWARLTRALDKHPNMKMLCKEFNLYIN